MLFPRLGPLVLRDLELWFRPFLFRVTIFSDYNLPICGLWVQSLYDLSCSFPLFGSIVLPSVQFSDLNNI